MREAVFHPPLVQPAFVILPANAVRVTFNARLKALVTAVYIGLLPTFDATE